MRFNDLIGFIVGSGVSLHLLDAGAVLTPDALKAAEAFAISALAQTVVKLVDYWIKRRSARKNNNKKLV